MQDDFFALVYNKIHREAKTDSRVVIQLEDGSSVGVNLVTNGNDWNEGKIYIVPKVPLIQSDQSKIERNKDEKTNYK